MESPQSAGGGAPYQASCSMDWLLSGHERVCAPDRLAEVVDRLRPAAPKVAGLLEAAESELLAFYELPREHWSKLRSTNPLARVNREIGRRTDVVGIFPTTPPCCAWLVPC